MGTSQNITRELDGLIRKLAKTAFRPNSEMKAVTENLLVKKHTRLLKSALLTTLKRYKEKSNFGKLRVGILLALSIEGEDFLRDIEAGGILFREPVNRVIGL